MPDQNNAEDEWQSLRGFMSEILSASDLSGLTAHGNQHQAGTERGMLLQRLILAFKNNMPNLDSSQTFRDQFFKMMKEQGTSFDTLQRNVRAIAGSADNTDTAAFLDDVKSVLKHKAQLNPFNTKPF